MTSVNTLSPEQKILIEADRRAAHAEHTQIQQELILMFDCMLVHAAGEKLIELRQTDCHPMYIIAGVLTLTRQSADGTVSLNTIDGIRHRMVGKRFSRELYDKAEDAYRKMRLEMPMEEAVAAQMLGKAIVQELADGKNTIGFLERFKKLAPQKFVQARVKGQRARIN